MRTFTFLLVVIMILVTMVVAFGQCSGNDAGTAMGNTIGQNGADGTDGADGARGARGASGHHGSRGAQGIQGPQGQKGDQGDPGQGAQAYASTYVVIDGRLVKQLADDSNVRTETEKVSADESTEGGNGMQALWFLAGLTLVIAAIMVPSWLITSSKSWKEVEAAKIAAKATEDAKLERDKERLKAVKENMGVAAYLTDRIPGHESMSFWVSADNVVGRVNPIDTDEELPKRRVRRAAPTTPATPPAT